MIEGESSSDFVRLMGMVDTANGIVPRQDWRFKWELSESGFADSFAPHAKGNGLG